MNYATICALIAFGAFLFYIKVIPSISDSYRTKGVDRRIYHAFFLFEAVLIAAQGAYTPDWMDIPYIFAGFLFYCISLAAAFWQTKEGILHVIFTYSAIVLGSTMTTVQLWPKYGWLSLGPIGVLAIGALLILVFVKKNTTYWQEILAIITVLIPIIQKP